jgi:hypothetical protein
MTSIGYWLIFPCGHESARPVGPVPEPYGPAAAAVIMAHRVIPTPIGSVR